MTENDVTDLQIQLRDVLDILDLIVREIDPLGRCGE